MDQQNCRQKIIVAVAPVAHDGSVLPTETKNPLSPQEIAEETVACARAGAALVHHHVRNTEGKIVCDLQWYRETVDLIRKESDIILNVSTGGVSDLTLEERCVGLDIPEVEFGSLNMGSTNFGDSVYINTLPDIRFWAHRMRERGVTPELEIFACAMVETAHLLSGEGFFDEPLHYNLCLGFEGTLSATPDNLYRLRSMLPSDAVWGLIHEGMEDLSLVAAALGMGASILRVGFEDGAFLSSGVPAERNVQLVEQLVRLVEAAGKGVATPAEAREILGLPVS